MSVSTENFIKAIYQIKNDEKSKASCSRLAGKLQVSHAAITDMTRKMSEKRLVHYEKYKELELTDEGYKMAMRVLRKHRLWELFLHTILGMNDEEVHQEAEQLEHATSEFLTDKIDEYLGYPEFDPHGDPIPDKNGKLPKQVGIPMSQIKETGKYIIVRLMRNHESANAFFSFEALKTEKLIEIKEILPGEEIIVLYRGEKIVLNKNLTNRIIIKKI